MHPNVTSAQRRAMNRSRRSMHSTRPAQPHNAQENAWRVRQIAAGVLRTRALLGPPLDAHQERADPVRHRARGPQRQ